MKTETGLYSILKERLKERQSRLRFQHAVNVGDWAARLGAVHGWDPERARIAGLLHDYAKEWSPKKLRRYVKKNNVSVPDYDFIVETAPNMLHAYVSSDIARRKGWIKRKKDLRAIASHTLGRKKMGLEEKILFIADFSAPGRDYPEAAAIRRQALTDLNAAFRETLALKICWQVRRNRAIHFMPVRMWNRIVCGIKS